MKGNFFFSLSFSLKVAFSFHARSSADIVARSTNKRLISKRAGRSSLCSPALVALVIDEPLILLPSVRPRPGAQKSLRRRSDGGCAHQADTNTRHTIIARVCIIIYIYTCICATEPSSCVPLFARNFPEVPDNARLVVVLAQ